MIELRRRYSGGKGSDSPSFSRLPAGYQEVEYLEAQGDDAYIKTNILYNSTQDDYVLKCKYHILRHTSFANIFGASEGNSYNSIILAQDSQNNTYLAFFNKATTMHNYVISTVNGYTNVTTCIMRMSQITVSDMTYSPKSNGSDGIVSTNKTTFCLFKANQSINNTLYMRAYEFVIEKGSDILCNLIPCYRISDRVAGMYDIVNDVFYTNAGTGEFLYGQDVHYNIPPEYQQVECLESTGTQYMIVNFDSQYHSSGIYHAIGEHMTFGTYNDYGSQSLQLYDYGNDSVTIRIGTAVSDTISPSPKYIQMDAGTGKIIYDDNVIQIDGALSSEFHFLRGIPLFGRFNTLGIDPKPSVFKRFYVSSKNSIVLNLIPCYRKSDNEAGMYDLVSGEFYTNAGTGKFEVGLDVID